MSTTAQAKSAVTHGDFHGNNLLVDDEHAWVLDFERTGPAHSRRDFAELEVNILTRLASPKIDEQLYRYLVRRVVHNNSNASNLNAPILDNKSASKAASVVIALRQLAKRTIDHEQSEYYWALLFDALYVASISAINNLTQCRRAIILVKLLADWLGSDMTTHPESPTSDTDGNDAFAYDVFVSYSSDDRMWVRETLLPRLEQTGLRVFIDFRDFQLGAPRVKEMEWGLLTARKTLLVLTTAYLTSAWAEFESLMLQTRDPVNHERRLIPLYKERCELPPRISFLIYVDFVAPEDWEIAWHQLLAGLGAASK